MTGYKLGLAVVGVALLMCAGCSSTAPDLSISDNDGSTLTTTTGQAITEAMLLGKWDIDGERTNGANGGSSVLAIPSDVAKDVLGSGWKFEAGGVLKIDAMIGFRTGSYAVSGNKLTIRDPKHAPVEFEASFRDGYLYLKDGRTGKYKVFEKAKFFNL